MSNIAGKAYAMNVVTPMRWYWRPVNKLVFWAVGNTPLRKTLKGLKTLSLIHYARWVIVKPNQFPRLSESQPKENLKYSYMFFFSNFNGSWDQYVDSFHTSIPSGLDLVWLKSVAYPKSSPLNPFHKYITYNQIWTNHYYSAYPMAASNDVKSAKKVKSSLLELKVKASSMSPDEFQSAYNETILSLQHDLSEMKPTPIVSLAAEAVSKRRQLDGSPQPCSTHDKRSNVEALNS